MRLPTCYATLLLVCGAGWCAASDSPTKRNFAAIIREQCLRCHAGSKAQAGLDLSSRRGLLRGGDSGPAIVPGEPDESLFLQRVVEGSMPPINDGPQLPAADVEVLRRWIRSGAPWDGGRLQLETAPAPPTPSRPAEVGRPVRRRGLPHLRPGFLHLGNRAAERGSSIGCQPVGSRFRRTGRQPMNNRPARP